MGNRCNKGSCCKKTFDGVYCFNHKNRCHHFTYSRFKTKYYGCKDYVYNLTL